VAGNENWAFPGHLQPRPEDCAFPLPAVLDSLVLVRCEIPDDAFTAPILGTERTGNGVVIRDDGLVLTIGYLITEASAVWLTTTRGAAVAGTPLAYDQATGFGLVQPLGRLDAPALERGSAAACAVGDDVIVAGHGGRAHALKANIVAKREFAGYWEYVLDEALFTAPAHPQWGGSALIGDEGRLLGIGSLLVQEQVGDKTVQGNMIVPIDLLAPILDDMLKLGRRAGPPPAWLGLYANETRGMLTVAGVAPGGPADRAKIRTGDVVLEVGGRKVSGLADMFRAIWTLGPAGTEVPLTMTRDSVVSHIRVRSGDRQDFLKKPHLH
jgi:S1-C subfamily serine protease